MEVEFQERYLHTRKKRKREKENNSLSPKWELTQMKEKAILIWRDGKEGSVRLFLRA